jgi:GNAT superfamily N-acetyltransferase
VSIEISRYGVCGSASCQSPNLKSFPEAPTLRLATAADARAISALLRRAFLEFEMLYTPEAFVPTVQPEDGILKRLEEGPIWIAEDNRRIIGSVSAGRSEDSMMVRGMAVAQEARAQRIGKRLLISTEDFARERGVCRMCLYMTAFLANAIRLYQSSGYDFTGEKTNPHGTELLGMVKILDCGRVSGVPR